MFNNVRLWYCVSKVKVQVLEYCSLHIVQCVKLNATLPRKSISNSIILGSSMMQQIQAYSVTTCMSCVFHANPEFGFKMLITLKL